MICFVVFLFVRLPFFHPAIAKLPDSPTDIIIFSISQLLYFITENHSQISIICIAFQLSKCQIVGLGFIGSCEIHHILIFLFDIFMDLLHHLILGLTRMGKCTFGDGIDLLFYALPSVIQAVIYMNILRNIRDFLPADHLISYHREDFFSPFPDILSIFCLSPAQ